MPHPGGSETLQQLSKHYRNPDLTKRDILQALMHYKGLVPKWDAFVFNTGEKKDLLCLDGTIPVPYKGTTYNIPICVWLLETHPYNAPMCYVKPTNDMQIKISQHVDQTGKIYLPYLHDWKHSSSDLIGLIQVMVVVFGEHPPVYAKPRSSHSSGSDYAHTSAAGAHPPYPTQPPTSGGPYMPLPQHEPKAPQYGYSSYGQQPPPAPYPQTNNYPRYPSMPTSNYAPGGGYGYPPAPPTQPPYPQQQYPPTSGVYSNSTPPYASFQPVSIPQQSSAPVNSNTISEEHIKASLLSAVEDKMKRRLRDKFSQVHAELDVLKRTHDDLTKGKTRLEEIINKLEGEQMELDKNVNVLREKSDAMTEVIAKLQNQEAIDVDEAVVTTTPLYKQLLNAFAEENAIEDAIYYLGEALRRGIIDLDVFLKHVRELSRKQFMLRALMQKCREKANLPCWANKHSFMNQL